MTNDGRDRGATEPLRSLNLPSWTTDFFAGSGSNRPELCSITLTRTTR
jgi:hypothetical protein